MERDTCTGCGYEFDETVIGKRVEGTSVCVSCRDLGISIECDREQSR